MEKTIEIKAMLMAILTTDNKALDYLRMVVYREDGVEVEIRSEGDGITLEVEDSLVDIEIPMLRTHYEETIAKNTLDIILGDAPEVYWIELKVFSKWDGCITCHYEENQWTHY